MSQNQAVLNQGGEGWGGEGRKSHRRGHLSPRLFPVYLPSRVDTSAICVQLEDEEEEEEEKEEEEDERDEEMKVYGKESRGSTRKGESRETVDSVIWKQEKSEE